MAIRRIRSRVRDVVPGDQAMVPVQTSRLAGRRVDSVAPGKGLGERVPTSVHGWACEPMRPILFVYGSLLRGEANHFRLAGAACLGTHRTRPCFSLYQVDGYPAAVRGGETALEGELYLIGPGLLRRLDRFEDHPRLYARELIQTPRGRAWIYLYRQPVGRRPRLAHGSWRARRRGFVPARRGEQA